MKKMTAAHPTPSLLLRRQPQLEWNPVLHSFMPHQIRPLIIPHACSNPSNGNRQTPASLTVRWKSGFVHFRYGLRPNAFNSSHLFHLHRH
jgi:hypothetical protein